MAESIFTDRAQEPTPDAIEQALDSRHLLWTELLGTLLGVTDGLAANWAFYKKATGWLLRIQRKKFTVCTVLPTPDALVVIFLLPERAVEAAREAELPEEVVLAMDDASVSKFGHAFNLYITIETQLDAVATLARIKLESK